MLSKKQKSYILPILALILLGFVARLIPHAANIAPITAIALFAGLYLPKRLALVVPLLAMFLGDIVIGLYSPGVMISVYGSFFATVLIGLWVKKHKSFATVLGGTLLSSIIFFLTTNAAVWAFGTMYAHTLSGLLESYTMAIPFFRNSLVSDLGYVAVLIGGMEMVQIKYKTYLASSLPSKEISQRV